MTEEIRILFFSMDNPLIQNRYKKDCNNLHNRTFEKNKKKYECI